jgi:hypothetical protein
VVEILPATHQDAQALYASLRASDLRECLAYGQADVLEGIVESVAASQGFCFSAREEGELLAVFGVGELTEKTGSPWMLGTTLLDRRPRVLQSLAAPIVNLMLELYPHLLNFVHVRNTRSVRWLAHLGFTIHDPEPYGHAGELFHRFEMHRHV